eukprot:TRINITY_DN20087_c0_g1_i2.p1 TRINITY_DN20087_c0_g1~~TRINITY_DN20087_c0_g1_i2.p1  ORF type:complete len:142 (+),score=4.59 TRINITY_DN20087_c0_g1_i2:475-900(+)
MPGLVAVSQTVIKTLPVQTCWRFPGKTRDYIRGEMDGVTEDYNDKELATTYTSLRSNSLRYLVFTDRPFRRVFDSSLQLVVPKHHLVIPKHRTPTALEEVERKKTGKRRALKLERQQRIAAYTCKMEAKLKQRNDYPRCAK